MPGSFLLLYLEAYLRENPMPIPVTKRLKGSAATNARARAKAIFYGTTVKDQNRLFSPEVRNALIIVGVCCFIAVIIRLLK